MYTLYLDPSWRNVVNYLISGDYQAKLMTGEASWTSLNDKTHLNKSRNAMLQKLVTAKVPHRFVEYSDEEKILVIGNRKIW